MKYNAAGNMSTSIALRIVVITLIVMLICASIIAAFWRYSYHETYRTFHEWQEFRRSDTIYIKYLEKRLSHYEPKSADKWRSEAINAAFQRQITNAPVPSIRR
jgi:hypothetical protein